MRVTCVVCVVFAVGCDGAQQCDPHVPGTICTVAGNGVQGAGTDGPALESPIYIPIDMAVAPDGELWVLDFNNYVVRAVGLDGQIRTVVGNGQVGDSPPPGVERIDALQANFNHATDLTFHDGYLYLAAWHNSRVKRIRLSDMTLENFAGLGTRTKYTGDGGPAAAADVDLPAALAFDSDGSLAFMDQGNQVIRRVDASGTITTIAGVCIAGEYDVACAAGQQPVACPGTSKLTCGNPAEHCGYPCAPGFGGDGGSALEARLALPFGAIADPAGKLAFDRAGNLIVADTENNRIRKIDRAGIITTIAGTGEYGYAGDDGLAIAAQLNRPVDIAIGPDDTVYFTDTSNNCVRRIDTAGIITRVAGVCRQRPFGDDEEFAGDGGPAIDALLNRPYGLEIAGDLVYIADSYNNRIRVFSITE